MSTVHKSEVPYGRLALILLIALSSVFWLNGDALKICVFVSALAVAYTIADIERAVKRYRQKPEGLDFLRSVTYRHLDFFAGNDEEYRRFFAAECSKPERIVHAATRDSKTGRIYSVVAPGRHHNLVSLMRQIGVATTGENRRAQGFITSRGRFLDRREALKVATLANQLIRKTAPEDRLFSEDVWDPTVHTHQQLKDMADAVIVAAYGSEAVVTIELERAFPQMRFMGNYRMCSHIRDSRELTKRKDEERRALDSAK
ncbi:hypothetical protein D3C71_77110 [compost metagenome]